ncbi:hypothetical protein [Rhodococcus sp. JVH1]|uniref:hypothetical protein n=1 Tax=Rhodococcus sp. JVH1 TaxID=745408 RepID=UPI00027207EB|nr:hypothetical protein [Rhodococcus sp. JVH1]EJJ01016.1 hypothetical protein JVH1_1642 [Rhodococcus sp. JVH1]
MRVLGIDPGAKFTGICVIDGRDVIASADVATEYDLFPADRRYIQEVLNQAYRLLDTLQVQTVAVETITRPSWHMKGRAAVDPTALLATAEVLGAVLGFAWPVPTLQVQPGKNGSQPFGTYPPTLVTPQERRTPSWQLKIAGKGKLCHQRSAYDVARAGLRLSAETAHV